MIELYDYARSSAAYRVRIALALKGLNAAKAEIHLVRDGGEQHGGAYKAVNPQGLVPSLNVNGSILTQSIAIIEYLDEMYPSPALLPSDAVYRALVRAMTFAVAADIHPIQNLRVLNYLRKELAQPEEKVMEWARHWIATGLSALEELVIRAPAQGVYCFGNTVSMADICLAPQMVNARRFKANLSAVPRLVEIDARLRKLPAFAQTTSDVSA
ncbi:MAG: maleylacetoacetate isomerase [Rhodospirillaceae bacterium]